ncbi:MAG: bifunctional UDP-N-acetylglucosamine diphosphorylase/glucosamine-1-phosphate N-acetyltransferase GlmU [Legionellales bacterium]|nr:bifunctional UDP-N-acetylglucosamine diphosphorylase/glucosamine-1-phosphate N-acetyltransferase GlmU [Legionellales bacterium]
MALHIVILAAGLGQRMRSNLPKVLHTVAGLSMLERVIDTAQSQAPEKIHVIIGHAADTIQAACQAAPVNWITQAKQLGTGHAVLQALPHIPADADVLVLYGDVPLLRAETIEALIKLGQKHQQALALLVATVPNPLGLGRIIRDEQQQIVAIIEEKDANPAQRAIAEIYSGICCTSAANLQRWLPKTTQKNAQKEYYFTDIIGLAKAEQQPIVTLSVDNYQDILGVNDRSQLHQVERIWQRRVAEQLLLSGVGIADANRIDIRGTLHCDQDVFIDINTLFKGQVRIGEGSVIGPNCVLSHVTIGAHCKIETASVLENCIIGDHCQIGPFARIRPGTQLAAHCKIGNFVEAKQAIFGEHSKANHLSYLGDVTIGSHVNIGAGTITCNYDGANKHQTIIEDGVNIGSDTQLVAPVTIGKNATIGAGSTIRSNAPPDQLTLSISQQKTIPGWKRKKKIDKPK